jgi:hypothetical protein
MKPEVTRGEFLETGSLAGAGLAWHGPRRAALAKA